MIASVVLDGGSPDQIAADGAKIYREQYQAECESRYAGQVLAIELETQRAFVAASMREAGNRARRACPSTLCYFKRVGAPTTLHQR